MGSIHGVFLNLDDATERRDRLLEHLRQEGLAPRYRRFAARTPTAEECSDLQGLKTPGEFGVWKSYIDVLQEIADQDRHAPVVHVLEDDARLLSPAAPALAVLAERLLVDPALQHLDVLFLDYFLGKELFARVSAQLDTAPRSGGEAAFELLPSEAYMACLGSFLVRRSSAGYLAEVLRRLFAAARPLPPVDIALRAVLQMGLLQAALLSPPLGASDWEQAQRSSIQDQSIDKVRTTQLAYILLRLCAARLRHPQWCADRLVEMVGGSHSLAVDARPIELLAVFESIEHRLLRI